jgi:hypothetical protein
MYWKTIEEACREPLGEVQFEKNGGTTKWKEARSLYNPWVD